MRSFLYGLIILLFTFSLPSPYSRTIVNAETIKAVLMRANIPQLHYQITRHIPHATNNFTEGLIVHNNKIIESVGNYGKSQLEEKLMSGKIVKKYQLADQYFAEGVTLLKNKIYQLTYREHTGFIYNQHFTLIGRFSFDGEGWGLTNDGKNLIMSNGSSLIKFISPKTFSVVKTLHVTILNQLVIDINELEYLNDKIFANIFGSNIIVIFSAKTGQIKAWFDISILQPKACFPMLCVANGVAHDRKNYFVVTGKYWPYLYQIKIIDPKKII